MREGLRKVHEGGWSDEAYRLSGIHRSKECDIMVAGWDVESEWGGVCMESEEL